MAWDARIRSRVGDPTQYARIDRLVEDDGPARGARRIRVVSGGGLDVDLHPDRALDVGQVWIDGVPLAWLSPTRIASPWLAEHAGDGWVRTFGGGLVSTVGLDNFGSAGEEGGQSLGTHGRIGVQPAELEEARLVDDGFVVSGVVRQATAFGESLRVERRIRVPLGGRELVVEDTIVNDGATPAPWMLLYHLNLGWPLIDDGTVLDIPAVAVRPRDADAEAGLGEWSTVGPPQSGYGEQVFQCDLRAGEDTVRVRNERLGIALRVTYSTDTLPWLDVWKLLAERSYVVALEPTNTGGFAGRAAERAQGTLPVLEPGESARTSLCFAVEGSPRRPLGIVD